MENQNPSQPNPIENPQTQTSSASQGVPLRGYGRKFPFPKYIFLVIVFVILLAIVGSAYFMVQNNSSKQTYQTPKQTTTVTPTPNLNPNTGTLYGDIKVRLQEVIK